MVSLSRNLMVGVITAQLLVAVDAPAAASPCLLPRPSLGRTFQPAPLGIPQRRLSGGTRLQPTAIGQ